MPRRCGGGRLAFRPGLFINITPARPDPTVGSGAGGRLRIRWSCCSGVPPIGVRTPAVIYDPPLRLRRLRPLGVIVLVWLALPTPESAVSPATCWRRPGTGVLFIRRWSTFAIEKGVAPRGRARPNWRHCFIEKTASLNFATAPGRPDLTCLQVPLWRVLLRPANSLRVCGQRMACGCSPLLRSPAA